jgi:hypothetical protein
MKAEHTCSRFGSGALAMAGTGPTIGGTELGMDHLFAMTVVGLNPVATRLSLRACDLLLVPVNGKLGQIKRLRVPSLPIRVFWHWPEECNPQLAPAR